MIDALLLAVVALVTWMVASDGPWGAAITFVGVVLSGLLAMNYFEPLAGFLGSSVLTGYDWQHRWDIIALLGIFAGGVFAFRAIGEQLLPVHQVLNNQLYEAARWGFGALTGYVTMAMICTSLHVAPLQREFLGFTPERGNLFGIAPDRQWLGFTQYVSETSLRRRTNLGTVAIFDGARYPAIPGNAQTEQVWSSFPIKYAARRERFASGQPASAAPASSGPSLPSVPSSSGPVSAPPNAGTGGF